MLIYELIDAKSSHTVKYLVSFSVEFVLNITLNALQSSILILVEQNKTPLETTVLLCPSV